MKLSNRLYKCYGYCGKSYPESEMIVYSPTGKGEGKRYCLSCYRRKIKEVADREKLYSYIKETYNIDFPTGYMLRQIKSFVRERGYTYKNIRLTLDYVFRIKKAAKPEVKYGIALVPYYYDEMLAYYKDRQEKRKHTVIKKPNIVHIKMKPFTQENTYRNKKLIDMERLLDKK